MSSLFTNYKLFKIILKARDQLINILFFGYIRVPADRDSLTECPFYQRASNSKITSRTDVAALENSLDFELMPGPKGLPVVGTILELIANGSAAKIHLYCDKRHRKYGPVFKEKMGAFEAVFVADAQIIKFIYASEGKFPQHLIPEPWLIYNKSSGNDRGLFFMNGPLWKSRRRSLNKVFLKPSAISNHIEPIVNINDDLIERWRHLTQLDSSNELKNLEQELYNWSIECLGHFIFGRRMGCVTSKTDEPIMNEEIKSFVTSVQQIFIESANMTTIPPKLAYYLNLDVWKRFTAAVSTALMMARDLVEKKVKEIVSQVEAGETVEGFLAELLLDERLEAEEIVRIVTDLFLAAADTTSHAVQWTLYLLARNPQCQARLQRELDDKLPTDQEITTNKLSNLHYTSSVVKEALRLYPVAPFLTRILTEDTVIGGYRVPKGKLILMSMYTTSRDENYFPEPDKFLPERWINSKNTTPHHASLPFGSGSRSCIGRRLAEMQINLLLVHIGRNFNLGSANENEVDITLRMITTPSEPIKLRLHERLNNRFL